MVAMSTPSAAVSWWSVTTNFEYITLPTLIAITLLALSCLAWILASKTTRRPSPQLPPGPPSLPLIGNLLSLDPELHSYFQSLSKVYGPIFKLRLGTKTAVVISSPALACEVLKTHDTIFANRDVPVAAREATYGGAGVLWSPYGDHWRMLRKICVRDLLSPHVLETVYSLRRKQIRNTINQLYKRAGSREKIGEEMFLTLYNVITGMMWGGGGGGSSLGMEIKEIVNEIIEQYGLPNLSDFYPGLARFDLQGIRKKVRGSSKRLDAIFERIIEEKRKKMVVGGEGDKDFLELLLDFQHKGDSKLTIPHIKGLLVDLMLGGTDTTSNTLEFALAELLSKPKSLERAQQELDTVVGKDNIVDESHVPKLPYLRAIMKETLRLHPTVPLLVPHCPSESCLIGGYIVPKGSRVFINTWAIHRDPEIWDKPLEFQPERFLDTKLDYYGNDFSYLPFSSGRRICAGITLAEKTFVFLLASLIHSFNFEVAQGELLDTSEMFGIVLKMKIPLVVILTTRLSDPRFYE